MVVVAIWNSPQMDLCVQRANELPNDDRSKE